MPPGFLPTRPDSHAPPASLTIQIGQTGWAAESPNAPVSTPCRLRGGPSWNIAGLARGVEITGLARGVEIKGASGHRLY